MLAVLNFSHRDHDLALNLLRWITELGGCKGHDLFLSCNRMAAEANMPLALSEEAAKSFDNVGLYVQGSEDERGWPVACNHAWREMVYFIHAKVQKPWLWLEPDVTPLKPGWMDAIAAEYVKAGKGFMGCDVNVAGSKRHVSGIAVYPPNVMAACKRRYLNGLNANDDPKLCEAWDMYFAAEFMAHAHFTPLIQHIQHWPGYPDAPTFKESGPEIHPEAVLFHRVKDGSLMKRLRQPLMGIEIPVSKEAICREVPMPNPARFELKEGVLVRDLSTTPETSALETKDSRIAHALKVSWENERHQLREHIKDLESMLEVSTETQAINKLLLISKEPFGKARICKRLAAAGLGSITKAKKGKRRVV